MYYIVENRDFPEWIKATDALGFHLTKNEDEAMHIEDADKAENIRMRVQDSTGNRWRVYEITEGGKQAQHPKDIDLVRSGYFAIKVQDEEWTNEVYNFLHKVLDNQPEKRIEYPVDCEGNRFQLETEVMSNPVVEVYIDEDGDIVVNSEYGNTRWLSKDAHADFSIEEVYFLCESLEHYLNED